MHEAFQIKACYAAPVQREPAVANAIQIDADLHNKLEFSTKTDGKAI